MDENRLFLYVSVDTNSPLLPPQKKYDYSGANDVISMSVFQMLCNIQLIVDCSG